MPGALEGIRIVDLTNIILGPYGTMPSEMRCVSGLKRMTCTLTCWPMVRASDGWLMRFQAMSVT